MPFVVQDVLQHKRNERQIREMHEREYSKYISNLRQQSFNSNMSYLSIEHIREVERARLRFICNKKIQYERIKRENDVLSERLYKATKRTMIDDKNYKYQQNLDIFNSKYSQQRLNEYKRINNENNLLIKRFNNVHGQLITKQQCDQDWQRHINEMKKSSDYPENIDRFVSNINKSQHKRICQWNKQYQSNENLLIKLSE
ncbi:unnamed protein product [Rotaria sp. Silwood2]|nr:unnamed protein product [Rotaria sp. Silwood2]CAF3081478.1 unnamed protein product [Rotaria sp. Silwood2]CAF4181213.1 unnamed protein product [Rotaria sp. Silwood2]CAF4410923.1 unnamed protein product [Rotaria sp. Silwood2]